MVLNSVPINYAYSVGYLGFMFTPDLKDDNVTTMLLIHNKTGDIPVFPHTVNLNSLSLVTMLSSRALTIAYP